MDGSGSIGDRVNFSSLQDGSNFLSREQQRAFSHTVTTEEEAKNGASSINNLSPLFLCCEQNIHMEAALTTQTTESTAAQPSAHCQLYSGRSWSHLW